MPGLSIAVVIRAFNEERWLEPLLKGLRAQTVRDVRLTLVDSGSVDRTRAIGGQYCDDVLDIETDSFSYGYALNHAIERVDADLIAVVSAHTLPMHDRWLERLAEPFGDRLDNCNLALTYGKQRGNVVTKLAEHSDFARLFPDKSRRQRPPDYFCNNANALIRRDLWVRRPFDLALPGLEDQAWAKYWMDQGFEIEYVADAGIIHIHEETSAQIYRRFKRESQAARMSGLETPNSVSVFVGETWRAVVDVAKATASGRMHDAREAITYRYWKARGTVDGINRLPSSENAEPGQATYQALVVKGHGQAELVSRRLQRLRPNEVLIRVSYVGICQTDLEVLHQTLGYYRDGVARLPLVPGHEYSGVVVEKGANVEGVGVGDHVVGECILSCGVCDECLGNRQTACRQRREVGVVNFDGACAEYLVLPARFVHKLPADLSMISACTVEPLAVVLKGLRRLGLRDARTAGQSNVLVVGAGAIGNLCSQVGKYLGHRVTTIDRVAERLGLLEAVCESTSTALPPLGQFQYFIEATGSPDVARVLVDQTPNSADVLFLGFPYAQLVWDLEQLVARDKRFVGSVGSDYDTFEAAIAVLPHLDLSSFDNSVVDIRDWERAYELHESRRHLKIKLRVSPTTAEHQPTAQTSSETATVVARA